MLRIAVPVKQVAQLDEDFELDDRAVGVDPDFLDLDLNEWDAFSLEAALQIREHALEEQTEVVVLTVGDESTEEALLACLAKGADRAVRVWGDGVVDDDPLAVAAVLAAAIKREQPELVLCGVQSSDAAASATGIALAGLLELPHTAVVRALQFDSAGRQLTVDRELEGGLIEVLALPTPALVTVQTGANEPRYATLRAIKQASSKPLERLTALDLGLTPDDLQGARGARIVALSHPPRGDASAVMLGDDAGVVADRIIEIVGELIGTANGAQQA